MNKQGMEQLQHWMKDIITTQGTMQYKLQRAASLHQINEADVVADTCDVSIYTRINVYTSGYIMRLLECIVADFPVLQKFMGTEVFNQFAKASLLWSPSTSYSLYDLGSTFINFLAATRPKDIPDGDERAIYLDLPVEIAKAERARHEAIRARGIEGSAQAAIELFPDDILFYNHNIIVETPPCLRLLTLKFPVKQLFDQLHSDTPYEVPQPQQTFLAISRVNYRLTTEEIEEWLFVFLKKSEKPSVLSNLINETATVTGTSFSALLAELCVWLPILQEKGFIVLSRAQ